jgi:DNA-binding CsgD family transcriptional regulator
MTKPMLPVAQRIEDKVLAASPALELLPGVVIIHHLHDSSVVYMSSNGLNRLRVTLPELKEMGESYHARFFNESAAAEYVPKIVGMLERNNDEETVSFFQQVRSGAHEAWQWHACGIRIFMRDDNGLPLLTISVAIPIDPRHYFIPKMERMMEESESSTKNAHLLASLTAREKQILVMMARDNTSKEISSTLFIAEDTVKTHRRNIKKKLGVGNYFDLLKFVQAFDLV